MPNVVPSSRILSTDWLRRTGLFGACLFGTYLFAAFSLLRTTPARVGLVLLALTFLVGFRDWRILGRDALTVSALFFVQHDQIEKRVQAKSEAIAKVLSGDLATVPSTSIGLRIHALHVAADLRLQRPWIGWGAGSSRYLLAHGERPELIMENGAWLPHLHNTCAEILVQLGAVGFILIAALVWLLTNGALVECGTGNIPAALGRFFAVSLVFVLIWNLTNLRFIRHDYYCFWIVFASAAHRFRLQALIERPICKFDLGGSRA